MHQPVIYIIMLWYQKTGLSGFSSTCLSQASYSLAPHHLHSDTKANGIAFTGLWSHLPETNKQTNKPWSTHADSSFMPLLHTSHSPKQVMKFYLNKLAGHATFSTGTGSPRKGFEYWIQPWFVQRLKGGVGILQIEKEEDFQILCQGTEENESMAFYSG